MKSELIYGPCQRTKTIVMMTIIPILVGALGTIPEDLEKELGN